MEFTFTLQIIEEIDALQQKLNERTDKLNAMKNRHNELTQTLDETETHLKQASQEENVFCIIVVEFDMRYCVCCVQHVSVRSE